MPRDINTFDPTLVSEDEIYKFMTAHWQHQNQLSWSRLYIILALESAILAGSFSTNIKGWVGCALLVIGTLVGFILYRLIDRDWDVRDQAKHLELLDKVHKPLGMSMIPPAKSIWSNGRFLMSLLFSIMLLTNLAALIYLLPCQFQPL